MTRDYPTHPEDKTDYVQQQKHGIVEIFVTLRLPINVYELGAGLYRIANYRSFDDYVSDCVCNDIDLMRQGEIADDLIHQKITGKCSPWMQNQKEMYSEVNKNLRSEAATETGTEIETEEEVQEEEELT